MPLPLTVSLPHKDRTRHFVILYGNTVGGDMCLGSGCGTYLWDRLSPVELADGGEIDQDATGCSPLCHTCSFRTSARIAAGSGWSGLETSDISALWRLATAEQARDLERELERDRAAGLDEIQRAHAALQLAGSHQGINDSRKVA